MSDKSVTGKTYLVTGASKGIGCAIATTLLEQGANVVLHWNSALAEAEDLVKSYSEDRLLAVRADLSSANDVDRLWAEAVAWKGHLDGLVNNAAAMLETFPEEGLEAWRRDWQKTFAVNVHAVADLCWHAVDHFKTQGGGSIVNIASRAAFRGDLEDSIHYASSKGAVVAMTRSIAKAYARQNIYAYIVAPGWVATKTVLPRIQAPENAFMLDEIPMGDACPPSEIGEITAFLLSGKVKNATGTTFDINGASYFH